MLKLCNSYIVVVQLILLFHIAHTFVLLTANVDDVKKIARKFVSDELADKIADFISRATETFAQQGKKETSEENIKDNSQVSAENQMYNVERHGFDGTNKDEEKRNGENAQNSKLKTSEKKNPTEADNIGTITKSRKNIKEKSRYIIESGRAVSTTTEKADFKTSSEDKMKESIKMIENNLLGATNKGKGKKSKQKKKGKGYKSAVTYDSNEAVKDGASSKENKEDEKKLSQRSFDEEIAAIRNAALEYDEDGKKKTTKVIIQDDLDQYSNEINENGEKAGKTKGKDGKDKKWWEKDMPKPDVDAKSKRKTWF